MRYGNLVGTTEVGDCPSNAQDLEVGAGREVELRDGLLEEIGDVWCECGIPIKFIWGEIAIMPSGTLIPFGLAFNGILNREEGSGVLRMGVVRNMRVLDWATGRALDWAIRSIDRGEKV